MVPGGSGETVLEVGTFNTHAEFTAGRPNGHVGTVAIMCILVGSTFHMMVQFNPTSAAALMVQPSVVEASTTGFIPYEATLSIHPVVEVSHHCFCLLQP